MQELALVTSLPLQFIYPYHGVSYGKWAQKSEFAAQQWCVLAISTCYKSISRHFITFAIFIGEYFISTAVHLLIRCLSYFFPLRTNTFHCTEWYTSKFSNFYYIRLFWTPKTITLSSNWVRLYFDPSYNIQKAQCWSS